jgi:ATP-dependent helicase/nuclease subunit B
MTAIAGQRLDSDPADGAFWSRVATTVSDGLRGLHVHPRDAVMLLPHTGLLAPARTAFARRGGWQPRIETAQTLLAALGPPPLAAPGMLSGEGGTDRLLAANLLRGQQFGAAWAERDPRAFSAAVAAVVETAHALHEASADQSPHARAAWWNALRQSMPASGGPGTSERVLARIAIEWAAAAHAPATDLLRMQHAAAWVVLTAAGRTSAPLQALAGRPILQLSADADAERPFDAMAALPGPRRLRAAGLEEEAAATTLAVLEALDGGMASIALIAQDRLVVRRIRALLERAGVPIDDETGWTLSTTRAAARLMAWLRASAPGAGRDAWIEALRAEVQDEARVSALEQAWRRGRPMAAEASAVQGDLSQRMTAWRPAVPRPLTEWLQTLRQAAPRLLAILDADTAGRQVLAALRLNGEPSESWHSVAQATRLDLAGFTAWVDETLEGGIWRPPHSGAAPVSIVPLAGAVLRTFDAVVFPGCDANHLGAFEAAPGLLPSALAREFGVDGAEQRRRREMLAFAQLLRAPRLTLLRRTNDGGEPLAASPLVECALLARRRQGVDIAEEEDVQLPLASVRRQPVPRPAPAMRSAMPQRLSATTVQALRDCPYKFFARVGLGLAEGDELESELDSSDYGRWIHALLYRFHTRRSGRDVDSDHAELLAAADAEQSRLGLDAAALLPYRAGFGALATRYLEWLQRHEAEGWRFASGETERRCVPPELDGLVLDGRLDRIDQHDSGAAMLIDYKTGSRDKLKQRLRDPLEDTQLAFYAALLTGDSHGAPPRALYLALGEREPVQEIEHPDVALSAALLVDGLAADIDALRAGTGAAALGEGEVCRHCEMRGLCRRDHWGGA